MKDCVRIESNHLGFLFMRRLRISVWIGEYFKSITVHFRDNAKESDDVDPNRFGHEVAETFAASCGNVVAHCQLRKIPERRSFPDLSVIVNVERQQLRPGPNVDQVTRNALDCADNSR